jgi:aldehyde dehydrogenase (NAD+)
VNTDHLLQFYIDGAWVKPSSTAVLDVVDPSTERPFAQIAMGTAEDVDKAVAAARAAFPGYSTTTKSERLALLKRILRVYREREGEIAESISREMGCPITLARQQQAPVGSVHLDAMIEALESFEFEKIKGTTLIAREAIGVVGLITPWNWPINQIVCKVAPALAAGCTMVLKPSEIAPINAIIFAEILHDAGVPKGVFNLVNGDGANVGSAISSHPEIDMVSFTGSTRAGIQVAQKAAETVKRVSQELGGKSANILLRGTNLQVAIEKGVAACWLNSGQSCNAPTRLYVPREQLAEAVEIARAVAGRTRFGSPSDPAATVGPVVSQAQFNRIQALIAQAIAEGAELVAGGPGKPQGLETGYYVRPTIFVARPEMSIAREEVFGPVLTMLAYDTDEDAIVLANDTVYGLAAYVQSPDIAIARSVAARMRAGQVFINYPAWDIKAPFGGYKQSGNGREFVEYGIEEFLETKAVIGYEAA